MRTKIAKSEFNPQREQKVEREKKPVLPDDQPVKYGIHKKRKKRKKPVEGMLEKQGYMDLYEGPAKKAKKKRRFTKVDEEV